MKKNKKGNVAKLTVVRSNTIMDCVEAYWESVKSTVQIQHDLLRFLGGHVPVGTKLEARVNPETKEVLSIFGVALPATRGEGSPYFRGIIYEWGKNMGSICPEGENRLVLFSVNIAEEYLPGCFHRPGAPVRFRIGGSGRAIEIRPPWAMERAGLAQVLRQR